MLGFDFDAVLAHTDLILCQLLTEKLKRSVVPQDINLYYIEDMFPQLTTDEIKNIIDELVGMQCTFQIPPYPGSMDFLRWYGKHNKIYVITNRPDVEPVYVYLQHNLDKSTFNQVEILYTLEKGEMARKLGIRYFIEDKVQNIVSLANNGIVPIVFKQNWNKNIISSRSNLSDLCIFVDNWEEIYYRIGCELFNY